MAAGSSAAAVRKSRAAASRSAAALIGLAAPQVGEHRIRAQRDGAAVGLDGGKGLIVVSAASPRARSRR